MSELLRHPGQNLPLSLMLVRHGQSAGNLAAEAAERSGLSRIDIALRDVDVPLSELGRNQADALGKWIGDQNSSEQPTIIFTSPYLRAQQTAEIILARLPSHEKIRLEFDERLREREFGVVDRLTRKGIQEIYPLEAEFHARLGKFYYRAPGGENWCDVILRLRSFIDMLFRNHPDERVLIVCHTVVVFCFRYVIEKMTESEILAIDKGTRLANCSLTSYVQEPTGRGTEFSLNKFNFISPMKESGEKITAKEDQPAQE